MGQEGCKSKVVDVERAYFTRVGFFTGKSFLNREEQGAEVNFQISSHISINYRYLQIFAPGRLLQ